MNLNLLHLQRKFTIICSLAGIISVFLPWVKVSGGSIEVSLNGFRGYGMMTFIAYGLSLLFSLSGNQQEALDKKTRLITLVCGSIALLLTVNAFGSTNDDSAFSFVKTEYGVGIWLSLVASAGLNLAAWKLKDTDFSI